jgi:hypothetical protein
MSRATSVKVIGVCVYPRATLFTHYHGHRCGQFTDRANISSCRHVFIKIDRCGEQVRSGVLVWMGALSDAAELCTTLKLCTSLIRLGWIDPKFGRPVDHEGKVRRQEWARIQRSCPRAFISGHAMRRVGVSVHTYPPAASHTEMGTTEHKRRLLATGTPTRPLVQCAHRYAR